MVRFMVKCPDMEGPATRHVKLSTAYREHRQLVDMGFEAEIVTVTVARRNTSPWGVN